MRSDVAFVVVELRRIGRELVAGSWSRAARPMSTTRAVAVMAEAMSVVVAAGVESVFSELRARLALAVDDADIGALEAALTVAPTSKPKAKKGKVK